jgi:hypothetical protein
MKIVVMVDGQPKGPFELEALKTELLEGRISPTALAWHEGREGWTELHQIPEVQGALNGPPAAASQAPSATARQSAPVLQSPSAEPSSAKWYFLEGDQTRGPNTTDEITALLSAGSIPASTFVFREGLKDWAKASSFAEFQGGSVLPPVHPRVPVPAPPPVAEPAKATTGSTPASMTPNPKKLFVWWPASVLGSAALGGLMAYSTLLPVASITVALALSTQTDQSFPLSTFLSGLGGMGCVLLGYFAAILVRYLMVVAPHKRVLRKSGLGETQQKVGCYDFVLDNSRAFIVTGLVVTALMLWQIVSVSLDITSLRADLEQNADRAKEVATDASALEDQYKKTAPMYEGRSFQEGKQLVDGLFSNKAQELASEQLGLLSASVRDAVTIQARQGLRIWEVLLAGLASAFSAWLWFQARKERLVEAPTRPLS